MYLIWTIVYLPLALYYCVNDNSFIIDTLNYFRNLFTVGEHFNSPILWYLVSVIYSLCFVYFLTSKKVTIQGIVLLGAFVFSIGAVITYLVNYTGEMPSLLTYTQKLLKNILISGRMFSGFLYIPLGIMLSKIAFSKPKGIAIAAASTILWIVSRDCADFVKDWIVVFASVGIFMFVNSFTLSPNNIYRKLRTFSTVMFFTHMWVWTICYALIYQAKTFGMEIYLITTAITLLIAYAYTRICTKNPRTAERPRGL